MVALDRGRPLFVRDVPWEDDDLHDETGTFEMDRIGAGPETDGPDRFGDCVDSVVAQHIGGEIRRNLHVVHEMGPFTRVGHALLSGKGASSKLCERLSGELSMPVSLLNPFHGIGIRDPHINPAHLSGFALQAGVAVGLAARSDCIA